MWHNVSLIYKVRLLSCSLAFYNNQTFSSCSVLLFILCILFINYGSLWIDEPSAPVPSQPVLPHWMNEWMNLRHSVNREAGHTQSQAIKAFWLYRYNTTQQINNTTKNTTNSLSELCFQINDTALFFFCLSEALITWSVSVKLLSYSWSLETNKQQNTTHLNKC